MSDIKSIILSSAEKLSIELIGFGGRERFASVDAQINPFSIFPEGKTVIILGKRICRGALRGVEEGTNFGDYNLFGKNWLEDEFLSLACYDLVRAIEDCGYEAVPVFPNPSEIRPNGVSVAEGRPEPNVYPDFDYAAVACGVAELSFSGLAFTPRFGSRQRFHMIITDAEIASSPLLGQKICDGCMECAKSCPLGAIDPNRTREIDICGKKMTVADIDYSKCRVCKNGALPNRFASCARPDRIAALCNRSCLCHLEKEGSVANTFETEFRHRPEWSIGEKNDPSSRNTAVANVLGGEFSRDGNRGNRK